MTKTAILGAAVAMLLSSTAHSMTKPANGPGFRPVASGVVRTGPPVVRIAPVATGPVSKLRDAQRRAADLDALVSFNLQYLQMQTQMQHENRSYTAASNIMKTKHDTVKNSIRNVR